MTVSGAVLKGVVKPILPVVIIIAVLLPVGTRGDDKVDSDGETLSTYGPWKLELKGVGDQGRSKTCSLSHDLESRTNGARGSLALVKSEFRFVNEVLPGYAEILHYAVYGLIVADHDVEHKQPLMSDLGTAKISVDEAAWTVKASVAGSNSALLVIDDERGFLEKLAHGRYVRVEVGHKTIFLPLSDIAPALLALDDCTKLSAGAP